MSELSVPDGADSEEAVSLVRELADVGDEVRVSHDVVDLDAENYTEGTIVDIAPGGLELDTGSGANERIPPTEIDRLTLVSERSE